MTAAAISGLRVLSVGKLFIPSGFTAEPDGAIYISNSSIA
jgi:hypothetical protein